MFIYNLLITIFLPLILLRSLYKSLRYGENVNRLLERIALNVVRRPNQEVIMLHAVSVGEIMASRKFVEELSSRFPKSKILFTCSVLTLKLFKKLYAGVIAMEVEFSSCFFKPFENAFVVYLGHHGDVSASIADIILPTPAYTEKSSTYMNIEGRVIQTTKCHNPIGEAKEEWKIFRVLSDLFEKNFNFNNLGELRNVLTSTYGQFALLNEVNSIGEITFAKNNKIENIKIKYNIENFYMNDSISRSSETMAKCTKDILNKAA